MRLDDMQSCVACGQGLLHGGRLFFYRFEVAQEIANVTAMREVAGLEMMLGSVALARTMSSVTNVSQSLEADCGYVCFDCYVTEPLASLHESAMNRKAAAHHP